jgi:hypothetical protein
VAKALALLDEKVFCKALRSRSHLLSDEAAEARKWDRVVTMGTAGKSLIVGVFLECLPRALRTTRWPQGVPAPAQLMGKRSGCTQK